MKNYKLTFGPLSYTFYATDDHDAHVKADAILKSMAATLKLFHIDNATAELQELGD